MYWKLKQDPNWKPLCLKVGCHRMVLIKDGFQCPKCLIKINYNMERI